MTDTLVTFETAKLAKEKRFDAGMGWNEYYYDPTKNNVLIHGSDKYYPMGINPENMGEETLEQKEFSIWEKRLIKAPTQSLLQKWCREVHGIDVFIQKSPNGKLYDWYLEDEYGHYLEATEAFDTYEEALEAGLFEALTLL